MKKENIYKFLYIISALLIIAFVIRLGVDYFKYNTHTNSAPFYVFIIERTFEFIIPSIIVFIVARIAKNKSNK